MKRNILEQIIRQVLNEASITIDIETLRPEDEQKMTTVHSLLKIKSKLDATPDRFSAADGFLIKIKRMGGRATDDTTGEKSFEISDSDIMQNAMLKLNTLYDILIVWPGSGPPEGFVSGRVYSNLIKSDVFVLKFLNFNCLTTGKVKISPCTCFSML